MSEFAKQYELPQNFVPRTAPEYIPPVSRNAAEIERRRGMPPGSLVIEQQYLGALASGYFMEWLVQDGSHEDVAFGSELTAAALLGSARLSLRGGRPVMRRHLHLPVVVDPVTDVQLTPAQRIKAMSSGLEGVADLSGDIYERKLSLKRRASLERAHRFGRAAGDAALWVALAPQGEEIGEPGMLATEVQLAVRGIADDALEATRVLRGKVGQNLSLAMIGGQAARLETYIEENAPGGVYDTLHDAQKEAKNILELSQR